MHAMQKNLYAFISSIYSKWMLLLGIVILRSFLCEIILFYCFTNYHRKLRVSVGSFFNKISFAQFFL